MRTRYQFGTIAREDRKRGPAVWVYRYVENGARKKVQIGSLEQYRTKSEATKAAEGLRLAANPECATARAVTLGAVIQQFVREELPHDRRHSTQTYYLPWIRNYIEPQWRDYTLAQFARVPFAIEQWLNKLDLAPKSKANLRSVMRQILAAAMRWGLTDVRNPLALVRVRGGSKRKKQPRVLTAEQCTAIAKLVAEPFRTMLTIAMCLGLRVSEILGLQWGDFDWDQLVVTVQRGVVLGREDQVKTIYSERQMPLHPALASMLREYQRTYAPDSTTTDWLFANPDTGRPWWAHQIQQHHIRRAGLKVVGDGIGWHTFRHTYSSLLRHLRVDVKVQQELLRHADIRTTMNTYTQAMREDLRAANDLVGNLMLAEAIVASDPN
ncbi:MAG: site-specific integrase [Acidobacteriales bacterium]|nr:site-specific integrase [Terriglobales bacterium]